MKALLLLLACPIFFWNHNGSEPRAWSALTEIDSLRIEVSIVDSLIQLNVCNLLHHPILVDRAGLRLERKAAEIVISHVGYLNPHLETDLMVVQPSEFMRAQMVSDSAFTMIHYYLDYVDGHDQLPDYLVRKVAESKTIRIPNTGYGLLMKHAFLAFGHE